MKISVTSTAQRDALSRRKIRIALGRSTSLWLTCRGDFGFMEENEVDSEEFVKVYLDGVRKYGELKKAGALLFEFVYRELSGKNAKDKDTIVLSYLSCVGPSVIGWKAGLIPSRDAADRQPYARPACRTPDA